MNGALVMPSRRFVCACVRACVYTHVIMPSRLYVCMYLFIIRLYVCMYVFIIYHIYARNALNALPPAGMYIFMYLYACT
jgi:hypothetical protein